MARESSPPAGMVTLDIDAEIAALEAANDHDRKLLAEAKARIGVREENMAFLRGIRTRVAGGTVLMTVSDTDASSDTSVHFEEAGSKKPAGPKQTQKYRSLRIMDDAGEDGLMAIEIINISEERFPGASKIERTSLSPLLAKMASSSDGRDPLVLHHKDVNRWSITTAGRKELKRLEGGV